MPEGRESQFYSDSATPRGKWAAYGMLLIAKKPDGPKEIMLLGRLRRSRYFEITCFCRRLRKDGSCQRSEATWRMLQPTIRNRTRHILHPEVDDRRARIPNGWS